MATPTWKLPAEDPNDPPTVVQLTAQMGLPTMEVEMYDGDGFMSPPHARRLAMLLNEAATQAEQWKVVRP